MAERRAQQWIRSSRIATLLVVIALFSGEVAHAQASATTLNSGDTAWMLMASALVLLMTPGLALFYGGMVRRKNVLSTMMYSFFAMGLVTAQGVVVGYALAFEPPQGEFMGGLDYLFSRG